MVHRAELHARGRRDEQRLAGCNQNSLPTCPAQTSAHSRPPSPQQATASTAEPHLLISRFSCTNLTFASVSADSSMAWLKPFSPPGARQRGGLRRKKRR